MANSSTTFTAVGDENELAVHTFLMGSRTVSRNGKPLSLKDLDKQMRV
ncbi:TPA: hypothetical protein ACX6NS_002047 [Photobacterium damselae]